MLPPLDVTAIALVIAAGLAVITSAILLRVAVKLVLKFDVPFGQACLAAFFFLIITAIIVFLNGRGVELPSVSPGLTPLVSVIVDFLVAAMVFGVMFKQPNSAVNRAWERINGFPCARDHWPRDLSRGVGDMGRRLTLLAVLVRRRGNDDETGKRNGANHARKNARKKV